MGQLTILIIIVFHHHGIILFFVFEVLSVFCVRCSVRELPARVYVNRSVYKGKAVLTVSPVLPKFTSLDVCFFLFHHVHFMDVSYHRFYVLF